MSISPQKVNELNELAKVIRLYDLRMSFNAGKNGSHLGGSLSAAEIMVLK